MKLKKLHIVEDSDYGNWYIQNCINCNNENTDNVFVCITDKLIHTTYPHLKIIPENTIDYTSLVEKINSGFFKTIYINYLNYAKALLINQIKPESAKLIWIIWSEDLYWLPKLGFKKYDRYSAGFVEKNKVKEKFNLKIYLGRLKLRLLHKETTATSVFYEAINKIDVCTTFIKEEVELIRKNLNPHIQYIKFAFISAKNETEEQGFVEKKTILIGNSADPANNQYEIVEKLDKLNVRSEIILPLSYGNDLYRKELRRDISSFNLHLTILDTLIPKQEYYQILNRVNSAIFAHNIQQAFGNIIALLFFGAKVFLKEKNPVYNELTSLGLKIFSIEQDLTLTNLTEQLSKEAHESNVKILEAELSQEKVLGYYYNLLSA